MTSEIRVFRHGERWAVAEAGPESPAKEYATREEAELAARQLAGGGSVEVSDEGTEDLGAASRSASDDERSQGDVGVEDAIERDRSIQPGL